MVGRQTVALAEPNALMLLKSVSFVTILTAFRALYANPPLSDTSPDSSGSLSHSGAGRFEHGFCRRYDQLSRFAGRTVLEHLRPAPGEECCADGPVVVIVAGAGPTLSRKKSCRSSRNRPFQLRNSRIADTKALSGVTTNAQSGLPETGGE